MAAKKQKERRTGHQLHGVPFESSEQVSSPPPDCSCDLIKMSHRIVGPVRAVSERSEETQKIENRLKKLSCVTATC
ncbi:hypothetical protein Mal48_26110 [Thalassoglobus polymorphus]|uniref:Uncharacterized protein n=1 Tax=Thalassoglobus polymorphus TaxID=2527994 RepID=A0A517QNX8_9PLAN|nr:hypothetical protein Mal48_26110 [Thalassoglobus polymorphus]